MNLLSNTLRTAFSTLVAFVIFSLSLHAQGTMPMDTVDGDNFRLIIPKNITVECSEIPVKAEPILLTNCPNGKTSALFDEFTYEEECSANIVITRMWDVYTPCQQHFEVVQEIYVIDSKAPTFANFPADITSACTALPAVPTLVCSDNCAVKPTVTFKETTVPINAISYKVLRTWTAQDPCSNIGTKTQTITIADNQKPVFLVAAKDITVDCKSIPVAVRPTVKDICDPNPTVTMKETKLGGSCADNYTLKREWTAIDKAGNKAFMTQRVNIADKKAPTFTIPINLTVECTAIPKAPLSTALSLLDNCAATVNVTYSELKKAGICTDKYTLNRTWTASDKCSNRFTKTQVITINDNKLPVFSSFPENTTVSCTSIPTKATPTFTDNCTKTVLVKYSEAVTPDLCPDNYTIKRTWTLSDACKNSVTKVQLCKVEDTAAPTFTTAPADVTIQVSEGKLLSLSVPATDNCDQSVAVSFSEKLNSTTPSANNGQCTKYLQRTWLAADNCKNITTANQNIYVLDNVAPVIYNAPADVTLACSAALPPAPTTVYALDTMGLFKDNIQVTYFEKTTAGGCGGFSLVERFWTAVDACNNAKTMTQKIHFSTALDGESGTNFVANFGGDKTASAKSDIVQKVEVEAPAATQEFKVARKLDNTAIKTVEVFTVDGRHVFTSDNFGRAVVQLNQHEKGLYLMKISDGVTTEVKKFMRQ